MDITAFGQQIVETHTGVLTSLLEPLGMPVPSARPASTTSADPQAITDVRIGQRLTLHASGRPESWTVIGVGPAGRVELGRIAEDGHLAARSLRWPAALEAAGPDLLGGTVTMAGEQWEAHWRDDLDVALPPRERAVVMTATASPADHPRSFTAPWGEVLGATAVTRSRPIARPAATVIDAAEIARLTGVRVVTAWAGPEYVGGPIILTGTAANRSNIAGQMADRVASHVLDVTAWHERVTGRRALGGPVDTIMVVTDHALSTGNIHALTKGHVGVISVGPTDARLIADSAPRLTPPGDVAVALEQSRFIGRHLREAVAHELGHVMLAAAGIPSARTGIEQQIVHEAMSDLLAATFLGRRSGVRDLGRLDHRFGRLDLLLAWHATHPEQLDPHVGTQLLTRPLLGVAERHGWDEVARIADAAVVAAGHEIATGVRADVDISTMARHLVETAGRRLGPTSETVAELGRAWRALRVLA